MTRSGVSLVVRDLTLGYGGVARPAFFPGLSGKGVGRLVLEDINLSLGPGERLAIVGASGSGKTTLLHALAGLLRPLRGEVLVDNQVVASASGNCTSRHAACMFQRDLLLPWKTARDNAAFAVTVARPRPWAIGSSPTARRACLRRRARRQAEALLTEFGLGEALDAFPHQLSGGMRQRVAFARTLILDRSLVLLDEPFAGLDLLTRADLTEWLKGVMARHPATWVLVTHDVNEAVALADRVAVLGGCPTRIAGWVETRTHQGEVEVEVRRLLASARSMPVPEPSL